MITKTITTAPAHCYKDFENKKFKNSKTERKEKTMEIKIIKSDDYSVTLSMDTETFEEKMFTCPDCGQTHFICDGIRLDDEYYCYECVTTCDVCGSTIRREDACHTVDSGMDYCSSCFENECLQCRECGARYRYEDEMHTDYSEEYFCDECWNERHVINSYHDFKDCGTIKFYGNADRRDELHMGWELEVDSNRRVDRERIAGGVKDILGDFVTMENDGSLSGSGFEIISQPATLNYHLSMMPKYTETFEHLTDNEMLSHDAGSCGFHVHADSKYLGTGFKLDAATAKLLFVTERYRAELLKFARRTQDQADNWCRSRKERYTTEPGWIKKAVYENRSGFSYQSRYYGLNLTNLDTTGTIEFRYFRGSLVPETIEASLKLVARLMEISKTVCAVELATYTFDQVLGDDPTIRAYWNRINNK